jgi:hypothetical protein
MYVSDYIKPCTPQLALEVGENLRQDDIREVEQTLGLYAPVAVLQSYYSSAVSVYFHDAHGKAAGVAGVTPENAIWMLCTPVIQTKPHKFVREAKRWLDSLPNPYVYNHADMRNEVHIKLLKFMGFTFVNYYVINGVPLISFIKPCANLQL